MSVYSVSQNKRNPRKKVVAVKHWNCYTMGFWGHMADKLSYFPFYNGFYTPYKFLVKERGLCTHNWSSQNGEREVKVSYYNL